MNQRDILNRLPVEDIARMVSCGHTPFAFMTDRVAILICDLCERICGLYVHNENMWCPITTLEKYVLAAGSVPGGYTDEYLDETIVHQPNGPCTGSPSEAQQAVQEHMEFLTRITARIRPTHHNMVSRYLDAMRTE